MSDQYRILIGAIQCYGLVEFLPRCSQRSLNSRFFVKKLFNIGDSVFTKVIHTLLAHHFVLFTEDQILLTDFSAQLIHISYQHPSAIKS